MSQSKYQHLARDYRVEYQTNFAGLQKGSIVASGRQKRLKQQLKNFLDAHCGDNEHL